MTRDEAYQSLSDLIFKGFLTMGIELAGKLFVFKTVNEKEFDLVKLHAGITSNPDYALRFNINYLIHSLLMVDGENVLKTRGVSNRKLYSFFEGIPDVLYRKIITQLGVLRQTSFDAMKFVEGFSYTDFSRRLWKICGNTPTRDELTGIPGTGLMGLNIHQESWILINKMLDEEEIYNRHLSLAILVASASNPKGIRKVRAQHDASAQKTEERRTQLAQDGTPEKKLDWHAEGWAAPVDTAEELVAELERQMTGHKDRHDVFMEDHMEELKKEAEEQVQQTKQKIEESHQRWIEQGLPDSGIAGSHRVLSPEEAEKLVQMPSNNLVIVASDKASDESEHERILTKIGTRVITSKE
jgi:hypothetical protein